MGKAYNRSDGIFYEPSDYEVQQLPLGPASRSDQRLCTELVRRKQLRQSSIQSNSSNFIKSIRRRRNVHFNSTHMARSALVRGSDEDVCRLSDNNTESDGYVSTRSIRQHRADGKSEMGSSSLQDIWKDSTADWSEDAQGILAKGLKNSTLRHYNYGWQRFKKYCEESNLSYLPASAKTVVEFLTKITKPSQRPSGLVAQICASISHAHLGANLADPTQTHLIRLFRKGITNSRTRRAAKKATPIDPKPIRDLFSGWRENNKLSDNDLRMKALALCTFVGMMRPGEGGILRKSFISFGDNLEYMDICLLGFKTDKQANGETFRIWKCSEEKLCPVLSLFDYIKRVKGEDDRIFPLSADRISTILKEVIKKAGLDSVYTARSFRSGGATSGIKNGIQADQLMKIGKWKTTDIFYNHYVAARPQSNMTDKILGISSNIEIEDTVRTPIRKYKMTYHISDEEEEETQLVRKIRSKSSKDEDATLIMDNQDLVDEEDSQLKVPNRFEVKPGKRKISQKESLGADQISLLDISSNSDFRVSPEMSDDEENDRKQSSYEEELEEEDSYISVEFFEDEDEDYEESNSEFEDN